jgi:hypothetical protein
MEGAMVTAAELEHLTERLELVDQLLFGRATMLEPQDLPGRYGRVVKAVDHVLEVMNCESVVAGGWAVWRHGFEGRLTQDVDIVLPADRIEEFQRVAGMAGFEILPQPAGRWPKVLHKVTKVKVDILPEGARPGTAKQLAPTTIPHPRHLGANGHELHYITLPSLMELKLAAGRTRDRHDIIVLIQTNPTHIDAIRQHLATVHADYVVAFDDLVQEAREQVDH